MGRCPPTTVGVRKLESLHGLSYGAVCVILDLSVLVEHRLVTDGRTDRQTDTRWVKTHADIKSAFSAAVAIPLVTPLAIHSRVWSLNWTRQRTGSQCNCSRQGVTWSQKIKRAARFWIANAELFARICRVVKLLLNGVEANWTKYANSSITPWLCMWK